MYRLELDFKVLNKIDMSCKYKYTALENFTDYVKALNFKSKEYKNGMYKIWLSKTDYKYTHPFIRSLGVESIPYNLVKLK